MQLDAKIPPGRLEEKWATCNAQLRLVAPNNRRELKVIVVGSGLAGASAAASEIQEETAEIPGLA